jgi:hypothetical protein
MGEGSGGQSKEMGSGRTERKVREEKERRAEAEEEVRLENV